MEICKSSNVMTKKKQPEKCPKPVKKEKFITYAPKTEDGKIDTDKGLYIAYKELQKKDKDGDGITSVKEFGALGKVADVNNDGKITAGERFALCFVCDIQSDAAPDGVVTGEEAKKFSIFAKSCPEEAKDSLKQIYDGANLAERENYDILG